jgi:two-component system, LytTR family, response regulator
MKMTAEIKAIIVEDVEAYLQTIELLVKEVAPHMNIIGKASTLKDARLMIETLSPDLIFLDIQFEEEGATAFDLLSQIKKPDGFRFHIIFITAHLEAKYYAEAFNYGALHFLEKPIDKQKLKEAIERAVQEHSETSADDWQEELKRLRKQISTLQFPGKIIVEGNRLSEVVEIKDIVLLEASGRYTAITLTQEKKILSCQNLGEFERKLLVFGCFYRIHHNKIINLNYVQRLSKKERIIEMFPPYGKHVASKERLKEFLKFFETEGS